MTRMEPKLIDFDGRFQQHLRDWMRDCRSRYETVEAMEEDMPAVYEKWSLQPASWLDGSTPAAYFFQFEDGAALVNWMLAYLASDIGVPDPLLDRIGDLGGRAEGPLLAVLRGQTRIPEGCDRREVLGTVINLLNEIESAAPMDDYIALIAGHGDAELSDVACDALAAMGSRVVEPILKALEAEPPLAARENLVNLLADYPGDKRIFGWLMRMFDESGMTALFASNLGKYGDEAALPVLRQAQSEPGINYLDYIEIRNAIERLGGEPEPMRDFTGDPYYESLKEV